MLILPPSVVKKDIRPFHSTHHAKAPKVYLITIYNAAFQIQQEKEHSTNQHFHNYIFLLHISESCFQTIGIE